MGGGWSTPPSGKGTPLGRRTVSFGPTLGADSTADRSTPSRRRHCWVRTPGTGHQNAGTENVDTENAGLVLEWRRTPEGGWSGLTQYVVETADGARAVLEWLPADRLRPR